MFWKLTDCEPDGFGARCCGCFAGYAAFEAQNGYMPEMAKVAAPDHQQASGTVCMPPEPQYFSTFIRDIDSTIVGIRYDIVEYVC